jgi:group I intron endonuclease
MSQGIIYLITNKISGHKYIGQTTQPLNKQWQQHIHESNRMSPKLIHRAFRKYGVDKFNIKVIDECDARLLDEKQQYWIEQYNTYASDQGYNEIEKILKVNPIQSQSPLPTEKSKIEPWGNLTKENRGNGKHCGLRVLGINIETGEEKVWNTAREAALEVSGDANKNSNILLSARKGYKCYGYRWKLLDDKPKKKAIKGVCKRSWQEVCYDSINDAIRDIGNGTRGTGLVKSLRNPHKYTWRGYYWFYN